MKKTLLLLCIFIFNFNLSLTQSVAFAKDDDNDDTKVVNTAKTSHLRNTEQPTQTNLKLEANTSLNKNKATRQATITLDTELQTSAGIKTQTLQSSQHNTEFNAHGKAINLHPLLALRNRYLLLLTEQNSARAHFKQAEQNINRQQELYTHGASSKRSLQEQEAQWHTSKAQTEASQYQHQAVIDEARLLWGKELTDWALSNHSTPLDAFLSRQKKLLQITLPTNKQLPDGVKTIYIEATGDRSKAVKAQLVSIATQTETLAQGESYYFETDAKNILTGMNVTAWIPEQENQQQGVVIPKSALLWHLDQALVYLKIDEETFKRQPISQYSTLAEGYFISGVLKDDDEIVTQGAQTLLSEELKGQIPKEDDD